MLRPCVEAVEAVGAVGAGLVSHSRRSSFAGPGRTYNPSVAMSENESESQPPPDAPPFLPGSNHHTAEAFRSATLQIVASAIASSNGLPSVKKGDWDFYASYPAFRSVMAAERTNLTSMINSLLRWHGIKGRCPSTDDPQGLLELLADTNDQLLERANTSLDEAAGLKKKDPVLLEISSPMQQELSGSWNRRVSQTGESKVKKLVTARNIQRPQVSFKERIDNSDKPFVPSLLEKPNAKKPLSILVEYDQDGRESYSHPYQYELDLFKPSELHLERETDAEAMPSSVEETDCVLVERPEQLRVIVDTLKNEKVIAVDLEHHWYRSYQGITSLMQISTWDRDFVIDPYPLWRDLFLLNEIFTDPSIVKVFHGADQDIMWLQRDFSVYVVNLFDTHLAAKTLEFPVGTRKYEYLLRHYCDVTTDKTFQLADWRIRPLPEAMLRYARTDTRFLIRIYRRMKNELLDKGNEFKNLLISTFDAGAALCRKRYEKPLLRTDAHVRLAEKSRVSLDSRQMFALKEMFVWRNSIARQEDENEQFVLPNHMLLKICTELPREMQGILACCSPVPPLVKQNLQALHSILLKARERPLTVIKHDYEKPAGTPKRVCNESYVNDPLRSPLDLSRILDLQCPAILEDTSSPRKHSDAIKATKLKNVSAISLFQGQVRSEQKLSDEKQPARATVCQFLSPYLRYKMLKPYLKFMDLQNKDEAERSQQEQSHLDQVRSIKEHFDALTAMTPADLTEERKQDDEEDEEVDVPEEAPIEEDPIADPGAIAPLRGKKADKNFQKKRKKHLQKQGQKNKRPRREASEGNAQTVVNYESTDFNQFTKKTSNSGANSGIYDPWQGYTNKHKKGGGKQKQRYKSKGSKSMSYK